jgi:hypothetical protein
MDNTGNMSPASLFLSHNHKDKPFVRTFGTGSESNGSKGVAKRGGNQGRESLIAKVSAAVNEMRYPGVVLSAACGRGGAQGLEILSYSKRVRR